MTNRCKTLTCLDSNKTHTKYLRSLRSVWLPITQNSNFPSNATWSGWLFPLVFLQACFEFTFSAVYNRTQNHNNSRDDQVFKLIAVLLHMQLVVREPTWYIDFFFSCKALHLHGNKNSELVWSEKFSPILPGRQVTPVQLVGECFSLVLLGTRYFTRKTSLFG